MQFCVNRTLALYGTHVRDDRDREYCLLLDCFRHCQSSFVALFQTLTLEYYILIFFRVAGAKYLRYIEFIFVLLF